jgi:hypothetical protein
LLHIGSCGHGQVCLCGPVRAIAVCRTPRAARELTPGCVLQEKAARAYPAEKRGVAPQEDDPARRQGEGRAEAHRLRRPGRPGGMGQGEDHGRELRGEFSVSSAPRPLSFGCPVSAGAVGCWEMLTSAMAQLSSPCPFAGHRSQRRAEQKVEQLHWCHDGRNVSARDGPR